MKGKTIYIFPEDNRFETISDFKWCLKCGGEIQFRWKGQDYGVVRYGLDKKITVYRAHDKASQQAYDSSDDALEYMIGDDRLRDIITQVEVLFRSILNKYIAIPAFYFYNGIIPFVRWLLWQIVLCLQSPKHLH